MLSETSQIAIIGRSEAILPLRGAGLDVFLVPAGTDARDTVERLIRDGYRLIFFTDELSAELSEVVQRYAATALPCLVELPWLKPEGGFDHLRLAVQRAIGADILGKKDNSPLSGE